MRGFSKRACSVLLGTVAILCGASVSWGAALTILPDTGTDQDIIGVTGYQTTGADMGGLLSVRVLGNAGNFDETILWATTGATSGAAVGTGWSLSEDGDTFSTADPLGLWTFDVTDINLFVDRIELSGFATTGGTGTLSDGIVFDRTDPFDGTAGSYRGRDIEIASALGAWDVFAQYVDPVGVTPDDPVGDIFRRLDIWFADAAGNRSPFGVDDRLSFRQDTDEVGVFVPPTGDIPGLEGSIPEPSAMMLAGIGALALCAWGRRRRMPVS